MTRRYAYSLGGSRAVDSVPFSKSKNTTILSSIQMDGTLHYTTFSGGTTAEAFEAYLENELLPYLSSDSILIMDNMRSHHVKAVKALLDHSRVQYVYLPPYSPDLDPIEKLRSKIKALLRKFKARTFKTLPYAIQYAFGLVSLLWIYALILKTAIIHFTICNFTVLLSTFDKLKGDIKQCFLIRIFSFLYFFPSF